MLDSSSGDYESPNLSGVKWTLPGQTAQGKLYCREYFLLGINKAIRLTTLILRIKKRKKGMTKTTTKMTKSPNLSVSIAMAQGNYCNMIYQHEICFN